MKQYQYKCKLLSDIVITASAATEGYKESLDYIPGSKFLGIVASKLYNEQDKEKTLALFHNGTVRFGDATPVLDGNVLQKVPFSWYHIKGESLSDTIYLHHKIESSKLQLKQARTGYFSPEAKVFTSVDQDFSLKSAHDPVKRKSKDSQMYGYYSLKSGTVWSFIVTDEEGKYAEEIKSVLEGKHRVGRSRSAEYGLVEIKFDRELQSPEPATFSNQVILYAKSNLCFYDEKTGRSTAQPSGAQLTGDPGAKIFWSRSQIRTRNYKTWNRYRFNKDADRVIIERGSVFVIQLSKEVSGAFFDKGIGSHKNEGFGEVLVNPPFLLSSLDQLPFRLKKVSIENKISYPVEKGREDDLILKNLQRLKFQNNFDLKIDELVNQFIKEHGSTFKGLTKSQWGTLRNYGKNLERKDHFEKLIFDHESGFVYRGQSEKEWRKNGRRDVLRKYLSQLPEEHYLAFVVKLSNQMAKN